MDEEVYLLKNKPRRLVPFPIERTKTNLNGFILTTHIMRVV